VAEEDESSSDDDNAGKSGNTHLSPNNVESEMKDQRCLIDVGSPGDLRGRKIRVNSGQEVGNK